MPYAHMGNRMYLREAVVQAICNARPIGGNNLMNEIVRMIEDFIADKFQSAMTGDPKIDSVIQSLFETIMGRKIK